MQIKIMRGIPGSGKSTYAKKLARAAYDASKSPVICSADDFFIGSQGYKFDLANLGEAHKKCMRDFLLCVHDKHELIIVDNTNINVEDVAPYVAVGEAMGYDVEIVQMSTPVEVAVGRNIHGVSDDRVLDMHRRLTRTNLPRRWKITHVREEL